MVYRSILTSFLLLLACPKIFTQAEINFIVPTAAFKGELLNFSLTGNQTNFQQGVTQLDLGPGIEARNVDVKSPQFLTAQLQVDPLAAPGFRDVSVATKLEKVVAENGFEVLERGSEVQVVLTIFPVERLYLNSFDPQHAANNPLLFNVNLQNDGQQRALRVVFTLSHADFGLVGTAKKKYPDVAPLAVNVFDNRQFDDYKLASPPAPKLVETATKTGVLPPGLYTYNIKVFDAHNKLLAEDENQQEITNDNTSIDLIGPGVELGQEPEAIGIASPLFQWFAQNAAYNFYLYEVRDGQTDANSIVNSLPVWKMEGVAAQFLQYPPFAEVLESGKTYAWQVTSEIGGTRGKELVYSELFWFRFDKSVLGEGADALVSLLVKPEDLPLNMGGSHQFKAVGLSADGRELPVDCAWSVIPSDAGSVDSDGTFHAPEHPGAAAVVARFGGLEGYGTVDVAWKEAKIEAFPDFEDIVAQVFGLKDTTAVQDSTGFSSAGSYDWAGNELAANFKSIKATITDVEGPIQVSPMSFSYSPGDKSGSSVWSGKISPMNLGGGSEGGKQGFEESFLSRLRAAGMAGLTTFQSVIIAEFTRPVGFTGSEAVAQANGYINVHVNPNPFDCGGWCWYHSGGGAGLHENVLLSVSVKTTLCEDCSTPYTAAVQEAWQKYYRMVDRIENEYRLCWAMAQWLRYDCFQKKLPEIEKDAVQTAMNAKNAFLLVAAAQGEVTAAWLRTYLENGGFSQTEIDTIFQEAGVTEGTLSSETIDKVAQLIYEATYSQRKIYLRELFWDTCLPVQDCMGDRDRKHAQARRQLDLRLNRALQERRACESRNRASGCPRYELVR